MRLTRLELTDVRNYASADLRLEAGPTVIVGPNAQGKTNLLEAVHYLAIGRSHRTANDQALVRAGREAAVIRATASTDAGQQVTVAVEIRPGRTKALVNGQPRRRLAEAFGVIRSVLFAPEDLLLVQGDPADRRRFLDDLLTQRRAAYAVARSEHDRALRQRNALLRETRGGGRVPDDLLAVWTETYCRTAGTVLAARIAVVHALAAPVQAAYDDLVAASPAHDLARAPVLRYELSTGRSITAQPGEGVPDPAELAAEVAAALDERHAEERRRGLTLVGPHRDDLYLGIGDLPAKGYASNGEQWSLALSLRLASREVLAEVGDEPVILLDDVFAELDRHRRQRLALRCEAFEQVLVAAAVGQEVPLQGTTIPVLAGTLGEAR